MPARPPRRFRATRARVHAGLQNANFHRYKAGNKIRAKLRLSDQAVGHIRGAARQMWSGSYTRWYQTKPPRTRIRIALWVFILVYVVSPLNIDPGVFLSELVLLGIGIWADRKLVKKYDDARKRNGDWHRKSSGGF